MDAPGDGTGEDVQVVQIRADIEAARVRVVDTIDALEYKADLPARLADVLNATTSNVVTRLLERIPSSRARDASALEDGPLPEVAQHDRS